MKLFVLAFLVCLISVSIGHQQNEDASLERYSYFGNTLPPYCEPIYNCCLYGPGGANDCIRWCVESCNDIPIEQPAYYEIVGADKKHTHPRLISAHVIDVPCMRCFLPDRKGNCRKIWNPPEGCTL